MSKGGIGSGNFSLPWKLITILLVGSGLSHSQEVSFERLFTRPYIWGTRPEQLQWSHENHRLVFLWNAAGGRFLDLYSYQPEKKRLIRLTDLEGQRDEDFLTEEEKDPRRKQYIMPSAGIQPAFDISRDGSQVAFVYRGDIYVVAQQGGKKPLRVTRTKVAEASPAWSPDGKKVAYLVNGEICVQDLSNGNMASITDSSGLVREFQWSPDGKYFGYVVSKSSRQLLIPNYSGELVTAPSVARSVAKDDPPETTLWAISSSGGKPMRMRDCSYGPQVILTQPIKWSPDSTRLLWVPVQREMKKLQIEVSEINSGKTRAVYEKEDGKWAFYSSALWSPDGLQILFSDDRDGHVHLYRTETAKPHVVEVTHGEWDTYAGRFSSEPAWVGDFVYFGSTEEDTAERHYYRVHPNGEGKEKLSSGIGMHLGQISPDGAFIAYVSGSPDAPAEVYVGQARVTHSPRDEFSKVHWPEIRYVKYPSRRDGKLVSAKIFVPPDYHLEDRQAKPRPAIFFIHGGGYSSSVYKEWGSYLPTPYAFNCYLAQRGFVVIDPDYRGSSGYGREWRTGVYLDMGGPDLDDVLGGIDYLRSLGNVDVARLGIWGISYGGFMTNMAMFKSPDAFLAGAAWSAVNDWENYLAWYTRQRLTTPAEHPEAYRTSSPVYFSQNLKNHLLMLHGMSDDNVVFQDFVELTEKLLHEGKSFDTFFYPEENHLYYRDESVRDSFRRTKEWFERYLGPMN